MNYNWLQDLSVFQVNRLENRAYKRQYRTEAERIAKKSSFMRSLNGTWRFEFATSVAACNKDFYKEDYDCSDWATIQVPGHFSMQGYGQGYYLNHVYTWSGNGQDLLPGQLPEANDVGSYVREFTLSAEDLLQRVEICFDGVESAFALWVNGSFIGYSEDSYSQSRFDLTDVVRKGSNKLAVQVFRFCSGSWLEGQDYFRLCGIFRDVNLIFLPRTHLLDLRVLTPLSDSYTRAAVDLDCCFDGSFDGARVEVTLLDKVGMPVDTKEADVSETLSFSFALENPDLWSSEHPNLYTLLIRVMADGQLLEITEQRVGIREFKIVGNIMYINGQRIVFHGVNRHEFSARTGRVVSYEDTLYDIRMMKANNINALRTSHYPNFEYVYDLCDEYGLYCCDEANVESHGSWNDWWDMEHAIPHNKMEWYPAVIDRANSMYQRDKNHASIIIWSVGNESYGGRVLYEESQFLRQIDPSRVVQYESLEYEEMYSGTREYPGTSDVESQMYIPAARIEQFLKERPGKPFILCEYSHSMGNSNGGLFKYTELERKYPEYQGGFLWDWVDQGQYDEDGVLRYGGDLRERPSDYEFCGNGLLFADRTVSPKMAEVKYCFQYVDMEIDPKLIRITNRYLFTNLDAFTFTLELNRNGSRTDRREYRLACQPGSSLLLENPFEVPLDGDQYDLILRVSDADGQEVAHQQYIYPVAVKTEGQTVSIPMRCSEDFLNIGIVAGDYHLIFAKNKGLVSYKVRGEEMIRQAPKPSFFRAATNNDCGNGYGFRYGSWLTASLYPNISFVKLEKGENLCRLCYSYELPGLGEEKVSLEYTVTGDGTVTADLRYRPSEAYIEMPAFGMRFSLYKEYDHVRYFGLGPDENYIDRNKGALLGRYEYNVKDNLTPYQVPQECGNRTGTRQVTLTSHKNGHSMTFFASEPATGFEFSALPCTPYELENALHQDELSPYYQTSLCIYARQMGVGGDDSWGLRTLDEFLLSNREPQQLRFSFRGE